MKPNYAFNSIAVTIALLMLTFGARQAALAADSGFSFAVCGDARTMIYVPYKADRDAEARHLLAGMFNLVMPQKAAEDLVAKAIQLKYDPVTHELTPIVMPYMSSSESSGLTRAGSPRLPSKT
jgi:hypothetical protein